VLPSTFKDNRLLSMLRSAPFLLFLFLVVFTAGGTTCFAQSGAPQPKSQEVSDDDGIPVLIKHLPNWESVRTQAIFANKIEDLKKALGSRPIFDQIEFVPGTEAVAARYDAGILVIVESISPQVSVEKDARLTQYLAEQGQNSQTVSRRIGNYNVILLDAVSPEAAAALLDQVKYEKNIRWLGDNPFAYKRAERSFVVTTTDIFISTVLVIVIGIGLSIVGGIFGGLVFFRVREQKRAAMSQFTDAGGMTRLNLDGFTPDIVPAKLLKD